jgi:septum site-determining protein MinC
VQLGDSADAEPAGAVDGVEAAEPAKPAAILRGSARGLEIFIDGRAATEAIAAAVRARLGEAPAFFRGSDVRVRVEDGPLPVGCLAVLDGIAQELEMRIVEVGAAAKPAKPGKPSESAPVPVPVLLTASGSQPVSEPVSASVAETGSGSVAVSVSDLVSESVSAPVSVSAPADDTDDPPSLSQTRTVVGPVRSGVILEHLGHIVILGDVNPGAEVRASGNIIVLGRLRGTAHAGIGRDNGFIMALRLEPQQLRIGRQVARAGDSDAAGAHPEIAHITGGNIVVERYQGRLPSSLAASI